MLVYQLVPQKHRWKVLLAGSYVFFWSISGNLLVFLLLSTFSIHHFGLWLDAVRNDEDARIKAAEKPDRKALREVKKHRMRRVLALGIVLHVGLLLCLKMCIRDRADKVQQMGHRFPVDLHGGVLFIQHDAVPVSYTHLVVLPSLPVMP